MDIPSGYPSLVLGVALIVAAMAGAVALGWHIRDSAELREWEEALERLRGR